MKEFNLLCKELENLDVATYGAILAEKSLKIIPALSAITESAVGGAATFATFILGAIAADGRLSETEFLICEPMLRIFFGDAIDYETCKAAVKSMHSETRALKKAVDDMVDILGCVSEELKEDIVFVCMMICAVDGKISAKEKSWIKQLLR